MSGRLVSDVQTWAEGENFLSDTTRTQMLQMTCETLQFYGHIDKLVLKIHVI